MAAGAVHDVPVAALFREGRVVNIGRADYLD